MTSVCCSDFACKLYLLQLLNSRSRRLYGDRTCNGWQAKGRLPESAAEDIPLPIVGSKHLLPYVKLLMAATCRQPDQEKRNCLVSERGGSFLRIAKSPRPIITFTEPESTCLSTIFQVGMALKDRNSGGKHARRGLPFLFSLFRGAPHIIPPQSW